MSEITPEKVAAAVCEGFGGWWESLEAALSVTAQGNVLHLETTRWADDEQGTEHVRHFRAVVVEGETEPIVLERPKEPGRTSEHLDGRAEPGMVVIDDECPACNVELRSSWTPERARALAAHYAALADEADRLASQAEQERAQ